jgi:hypothetical protein
LGSHRKTTILMSLQISGIPARTLLWKDERVTDPMPDFAIFDVVDLLDVPETQKFDAVLDVLSLSHNLGFPKRGGALDDNLKNFKRIANLSAELASELEELNMHSRFYLKLQGREQRVSYADYLNATRSLKVQAEAAGSRKRARHRPRGSIKSRDLRHLICTLYEAAEKRKSKLTLGRDVHLRPTGTLPAIIEIFSNYFRSIPAQVSHKTLYRERKYALQQREQKRRHKPLNYESLLRDP